MEQELVSAMTGTDRADSLVCTLSEVHRVGGNARERLSADMTRLVGALTGCAQVDEDTPFVEYSAVLTGCLELLSAFSGMERENITRGPGWVFLGLGRRLERAMYSVRQLREITKPLTALDWPLLEYLLEVADSSMTYRSRYYTTLQPIAMLDVLMADETNPRSLDFQVSHLAGLYQRLPRHNSDDLQAIRNTLQRLRTLDLRALNYPLPGAVSEQPRSEEGIRLDHVLRELGDLLPSWSNNLSAMYFSHARTFPIAIGE
jgi:uncharacterized alpha-E superfamily protein